MPRINTYKSEWEYEEETGNYTRFQKDGYALEGVTRIVSPLLRILPKGGSLIRLLSKKEQGVDFYKSYIEMIRSGAIDSWEGEFEIVRKRLRDDFSYELKGRNLLDISGEPGLFAKRLLEAEPDNEMTVTAYAAEVAEAMKVHLGVNSVVYDYQRDTLAGLFPGKVFDLIFLRWSIGFCMDWMVCFDSAMNRPGRVA